MLKSVKKAIAGLAIVTLSMAAAGCGGQGEVESRNAVIVAGKACKTAGKYTSVSKQKVVCGRTAEGKKWFAVAKVRRTSCRTLGVIRKSNGVAFVCGRTRTARVWMSTRPLPAVTTTAPATPAEAVLQLQSTEAASDPMTAVDPGTVAGAPVETVPPIGATTTTIPRVPGPYAADLQVLEVASSSSSACAILTTGAVNCWGSNTSGDLGNPEVSETLVPVVNSVIDGRQTRAVSIAASPYGTFCAATTAGSVWCWGYGLSGELGDGKVSSSAAPVQVIGFDPSAKAVKVYGGFAMFCSTDSMQRLWCWGGNGVTGRIPTAQGGAYVVKASLVLGMEKVAVTSAVISRSSVCALSTAGAVWCWGSNFDSTMGTSKNAGQGTVMPPTMVAGIGQAPFVGQQISGNMLSVCVLSTVGTVKCWGTGSLLGTGNSTTSPTPLSIAIVGGTVPKAKSLTSGVWSNCLITADGALWCWGTPNINQSTMAQTLLSPTLMTGYDGVSRKAKGFASSASSMFVVTTGNALDVDSDGMYGLRGDGYPQVEEVAT